MRGSSRASLSRSSCSEGAPAEEMHGVHGRVAAGEEDVARGMRIRADGGARLHREHGVRAEEHVGLRRPAEDAHLADGPPPALAVGARAVVGPPQPRRARPALPVEPVERAAAPVQLVRAAGWCLRNSTRNASSGLSLMRPPCIPSRTSSPNPAITSPAPRRPCTFHCRGRRGKRMNSDALTSSTTPESAPMVIIIRRPSRTSATRKRSAWRRR